MKLFPENIYHIYNRGNNRRMIFYNRDNYIFFRDKIKKHLITNCNLLCYCLMPNHFHLMVYINNDFNQKNFSEGLKIVLGSYSKAVNKINSNTGSIFQQNTKIKLLTSYRNYNYAFICFNYIHQNPIRAGLVNKMEDWEFSSFREYMGLRHNKICNIKLAKMLFGLPDAGEEFYKLSNEIIKNDDIKAFL